MIEFTIGGRKIRPEDVGEELKKAAAGQITEQLQEPYQFYSASSDWRASYCRSRCQLARRTLYPGSRLP
jgi:hypothetical protein